MKTFLSVFISLFTFNCYAIEMEEIVYWYPTAVANTLLSGILPETAMKCFNDFRNKTWKPSAGYSAYEFGINCMYALHQCNTEMNEDDIYSGCAKLAVRLISEQNKHLKKCEQNPEDNLCTHVIGEACEPEGAIHTIEYTNVYSSSEYDISTEKIICKDKIWQKFGQGQHVIRSITEQELQNELYNRCFSHQIFISLGGEKNRYFDCDLQSRKCLVAIETDSKAPTTWWFCCKLFNDGEIAYYDGGRGTDGTIEKLKPYLKRRDLCSDQDWLND